jgi:hypothetical protein
MSTHNQVDLTGTTEKVRLSGLPDEYTHYQVYLSGLPNSECVTLIYC